MHNQEIDRHCYTEEGDDDDHEEVDFSPEEEKHISVDPLSLTPAKFLSASLPCSVTSSPNSFPKCQAPDRKNLQPLARHHQEHDLRRSKSCGEGRASAPSDEFDILPRKSSTTTTHQPQVIYERKEDYTRNPNKKPEQLPTEEEFKCGALCLFLPGFTKKKHEHDQHHGRALTVVSRVASLERLSRAVSLKRSSRVASLERLSRVASFEKFECGSWTESHILDGGDREEGGMHSYFDLPLELIRSGDDAESPVRAAFVYERDRKGVLKKSSSRMTPRKSIGHVRFSTSTPVSYPPSPSSGGITPRLLKARNEFNALLEAQEA